MMTREEAIQKIQNDLKLHHDYLSGDYRKSLRMAISALEQPEIIRCKDCEWYNFKINQCNRQICAVMYEDDFCSHAERRTDAD